MRSETAEVRKLLRYWEVPQSTCNSKPAYQISIPPRFKSLQRIAGRYTKDAKRGEKPQAFEISVRPKAILYAGVSQHYSSCLNFKAGMNRHYIPDYLKNAYVCVAGVRNKSTGEFLSRVFVHLCLTTDHKEILVLESIYGDYFPIKFFVEEMFRLGFEVWKTSGAELNGVDRRVEIEFERYRKDGPFNQPVQTLTSLKGYYFTPAKIEDRITVQDKYGFSGYDYVGREGGFYVDAQRISSVFVDPFYTDNI